VSGIEVSGIELKSRDRNILKDPMPSGSEVIGLLCRSMTSICVLVQSDAGKELSDMEFTFRINKDPKPPT
jgi:hypothetical protein